MAALADRFGLHPAHTYSVVHHRDVATVMRLALAGVMDGRIVNVTDDAPVSVYEMADSAGNPIAAIAEPLDNPWSGRMDGTLFVSSASGRPCRPSTRQPVTGSCRYSRANHSIVANTRRRF